MVGGGIIGCSTALELARAGADVFLIERSEIASAASGRNHGLIFYPQDETADPLYRKSHEIYLEISRSSEIDIGLDEAPCGFIIAVAEEDQWAGAEAEAKASEAGGARIERLDAWQLAEAEPSVAEGHLGGYFIDDGYRLDPAALTLAIALQARREGAEILTHTDVKQVLTKSGRVHGVATDDGVVETAVVVDAAGPWAPKLARSAGADLRIIGARGWLLLTAAVPPLVNHLVESPGWHLTAGDPGPAQVSVGGYARMELPAAPDIGLIVQQNRSGHVLLGGSRLASMREDPEGVEITYEIAHRAIATVPALKDVPLIGVWSGVRPMSIDGLPLIGWVPSIEGFFVAGGHGGQGVMLGGGTGLLAAQMIERRATFCDAGPFDPGRVQAYPG